MMNEIKKSFFAALILTIFSLQLIGVSMAQVMSSPSYKLQSDSVNVGGGLSSSTSYVQESTIGEVATGKSDSTTYSLRAGYQQMQEVYLSMSVPDDVVLDGSIGGFTGGTSTGSTTVTVITDSPSGYQLTLEAENNPAMQREGGGDDIADYDAGPVADFFFNIGSSQALLGYSPSGVDIVQAFKDNGSACNVDTADDVDACWDGLTTTAVPIADAGVPNHPDGATTTVYFQLVVSANAGLLEGFYTATATLTALPL